jgi:hypothetical protein
VSDGQIFVYYYSLKCVTFLHDFHLCSWVHCHVTEDWKFPKKNTDTIHYASKIIFAIPLHHSVSAQLDRFNFLRIYFSSPLVGDQWRCEVGGELLSHGDDNSEESLGILTLLCGGSDSI